MNVGGSNGCSIAIPTTISTATVPTTRNQHSYGGKNQHPGKTLEYREKTKDPAIPTENVAIVMQFLKLKPLTFNNKMDPIKANEWLLEIEKNFRLLTCGEQ